MLLGLASVPRDLPGTVVAIGVFDGVHRGHQQIIEKAHAHAQSLGLPVYAVTFDPHPSSVTRSGAHPHLLQTLADRVGALMDAGVDEVVVVEFTPEFAALSPDEFVDSVLVEALHARFVVVGENFRFGRRASGDPETLAEAGRVRGFGVESVPLASENDEPWSSTYIRGLVTAGDVRRANAALGRPYRLSGVVAHGDARGRELGFPTANLEVTDRVAVPGEGVYACWMSWGDGSHMAAVSVGTNPQFKGESLRIEAHALDCPWVDLYGRTVTLDFVARIRGQWVFPGLDELIHRIEQDISEVRVALGASRG